MERHAVVAGSTLKVGKGPILTSILALAVAGSAFLGNVVFRGDTGGIIAGTRAAIISANTGSVLGSGSTVSTVYLPSPFAAGASRFGYRTGSGVGTYFQLDIVANPTAASWDCHRTVGKSTGTASTTAIFTNVAATGSINVSQTALTFGPTQGIACHTLGRINSTTNLRLRSLFSDSDVTN